MSTLKELGEFGFIERVRDGCLTRPAHVVKAIGDDAAAFVCSPDRLTLVTTDLLVQGIHFDKETLSARDLGFKALAVNLSDIAAMGGTAREAFVSIAIPPDCSLEYLEELYRGMKDLASRYRVNILGGDTTGSPSDLVINITVVGEVAEEQLLRRDGARIGDRIYCTGTLGDSRAGLHLLSAAQADPHPHEEWESLKTAHRLPRPHLEEGRFLATQPGVHAAIDVSDGLSSDIARIAEQSAVGACLRIDWIPVSDALIPFCRHFGFDPAQYALEGGEDYCLLFTAAPEVAPQLEADFQARFSRSVFAVGTVVKDRALYIENDRRERRLLRPSGWDHFKKG